LKILVVGSGAREHALAWRLAQKSPSPTHEGSAPADSAREILVCPGNAGIAREFRCVAPRGDGIAGVVELARAERVDLVVVGPEQWLVDGLVDALAEAGIAAFGPSKGAARLEGSKAFMKQVCQRAGVASAGFIATARFDEARRFIEERARAGKGVVVKADGLCAGKGVVVCPRAQDAVDAARAFLGVDSAPRFGDASRTIVVEDILPGEELSIFGVCDGYDAVLFGAARDHKRLRDGDQGPNTGGMGAVAPLDERHGISDAALARIRETVFLPVLDEMRGRGVLFRGLLFAGLMVHDGEPRLLEFNVRFGDPETQALLMATSVDLVPLFVACATGERLPKGTSLTGAASEKAAVVVLAADGYPDAPKRGAVVEGLEEAEQLDGVKVFYAGVAPAEGGRGGLVAAGGRVLAVAGRGARFDEALDRAYAAVDKIRMDGAQVRRDIGKSVRGT
jgi:phosphoribosylamine---glycine ligase